jgi:predicted dehydrogenase
LNSGNQSACPRLALVGVGSMGSNHARVIAESPDAELGVIVDTDSARAARLAATYGCEHAPDLAAASGCDAAVVATPTRLHAEQARALLEMNLPLLIEKPLTPSIGETRALVDLAAESGLPLMCGFVERFNPVVQTVVGLLEETPVHIVGLRHSPHTPRTTLSVTLDLLIHEIDCALLYAGGQVPTKVSSAIGMLPAGIVSDAAGCLLSFESGTVATLSASRTSQHKVRWQTVDTPSVSYEIDLLRQNITMYRHRGHEVAGTLSYRAETIIDIPFVRHGGEPLALQLRRFVSLLGGGHDVAAERASILAPHEVAALVEAA